MDQKKRKKFFIYEGIAQITPLEVNIVSEFAVDLEGQNKNGILSKEKFISKYGDTLDVAVKPKFIELAMDILHQFRAEVKE